MCYSGYCYFENHMGDCRVIDYDGIKELTGFSACYIGGGECNHPETQEAWESAYKEGNIDKWIESIRENKLIF